MPLRLFALAAVLAGPQAVRERPEVQARQETWARLTTELFELRWILPPDLPRAERERGLDVDLIAAMERLSRACAPVEASAGPRSFGDVVAAVRAGAELPAVLARLCANDPALAAELAPILPELLCTRELDAGAWDPEDDGRCDGIFFARPLSLAGVTDAPWKGLHGSRLLQQACVLVHADLEALKAAENDYTTYAQRSGASYEYIYPLDGSYWRGLDPNEQPFTALRLRFKCDLPFPFSHYGCDLRILNRIDERGRLSSEIYSTSRDFHWLAGRDVYLPLAASDGAWQGTLVVRLFGFDLDGVPDGDEARRTGTRSTLGNLKRDAERLFRAHGGPPRTLDGRWPEFRVFGER